MVTALFAIVPKLSIFMALLNIVNPIFAVHIENQGLGLPYEESSGLLNINEVGLNISNILIGSALLSIIIGSLGAINQMKLKRLLAYSAISHVGFILLGIIPGTFGGLQAILIYFVIYIIMSLSSFSFIFMAFNIIKITSRNLRTSYLDTSSTDPDVKRAE